MSKKEHFGMAADGATEVVFSMDTTGSMQGCIAQVRSQLEEIAEEMLHEIEGLKIGFIAHGDYCDGDNLINSLPLTSDKAAIFDFIRNAPNTTGGDAPEAYADALHEAQSLGWSGPGGALIMIGDAPCHPASHDANTNNYDWKEETDKLKEMGISIYALECQGGDQFWKDLAEHADTPLMRLNDFVESAEMVKGFAYAAAGADAFDAYESKLAASGTASAETVTRNSALRKESMKFKKG